MTSIRDGSKPLIRRSEDFRNALEQVKIILEPHGNDANLGTEMQHCIAAVQEAVTGLAKMEVAIKRLVDQSEAKIKHDHL